MGGLWEGYGRDEKNPSRAGAPLYKGIPEDLGRDEGFLVIIQLFNVTADSSRGLSSPHCSEDRGSACRGPGQPLRFWGHRL